MRASSTRCSASTSAFRVSRLSSVTCLSCGGNTRASPPRSQIADVSPSTLHICLVAGAGRGAASSLITRIPWLTHSAPTQVTARRAAWAHGPHTARCVLTQQDRTRTAHPYCYGYAHKQHSLDAADTQPHGATVHGRTHHGNATLGLMAERTEYER
eukprot:6942058-Prymnesium_polylepis.1